MMGEHPTPPTSPPTSTPVGVPIEKLIETGATATLPLGFLLGHTEDEHAGTGCTVVICEQGAVGASSVRGAAPATRETDLLKAHNTVERVDAVVLSGGSAFGLDSAGGVMRWLAEHEMGFDVGGIIVPIVCGACIFDLTVGAQDVYPDASFGYAACENARENAGRSLKTGNVGAGMGASVGKLLGEPFAMKGGFGAASVTCGEIIVTALVAVNALGNVFDRANTQTLAGVRDPQKKSTMLDPYQAFSIMT
ncbi:MAG: P1 family peptidase, partial [Coriobacteriales bacterium]|nr:P1 family peptidase [Coriobacteriales bacterium]